MSSTTEALSGSTSTDGGEDWELDGAVLLQEEEPVAPVPTPKPASKPVEEKVHKCDKCGRVCKDKNALKQHTCLFGIPCTIPEQELHRIGVKYRQILETLASLLRQESKTRGKEAEEARLAVYETCIKKGNPEMAADYVCAMLYQLLVSKTSVSPQKGIQGVAGKLPEWDSLPRLRMTEKQFAALYSFSSKRVVFPVPSNYSYVLGYPFGAAPPKKKEVMQREDEDDLQFF